jgi:hypothetical protein
MFRFAKSAAGFWFPALLLAALIVLSGCSAEESLEPASPQEPAEQPYYLELPTLSNPAPLLTLVTNPISVELEPIDLPGDLWSEVVYIRGLADKSTEKIINAALKETYDYLTGAGLPPYRGIYQAVPAGTPMTTQSIYAYSTFNYNNILSVYVSGDQSYEMAALEEEISADENYGYEPPIVYIGRAECLNFDLRSGRQILLPELFADPSVAMTYINDAVANKLLGKHATDEPGFDMMTFDSLLLTGPFKGLPDTQKYFLTSDGIAIVLDYLNPEFDHAFYPSQIHLPFSIFEGHLALEQRFQADSSDLYVDTGIMEIHFVQRNEHDPAKITWFEEAGTSGAVHIFRSYYYPNNLPERISLRISELRREAEADIESLKDYQPESTDDSLFFDVSITVNRLGPYYILRYHQYSQGIDTKAESFLILESYSEDGRIIELEDCFKPGYNYREALYSAYLEQAAWLGGTTQSQEEMFRDLTFAVGVTDLEFTVSDAGNSYMYFIPYRELGYENLALFD